MTEEWGILVEVYDDTEADIIMELLRSCNIPSQKRYSGPYRGLKVIMGKELGVSIWAPLSMLERARQLIKNINDS